jgi:hypothetical protein
MRATKRPRKRAARHTRAAAKSEIAKVPLDQTRIEFDEDDELDETLSDLATTLTWMPVTRLKVNTNKE